jgi:hypothetical protein
MATLVFILLLDDALSTWDEPGYLRQYSDEATGWMMEESGFNSR